MIIVIRADSSAIIGSGHLMRCLTLADRLQKAHRAEIHFICRELEGNLSNLVKKAGYILHLLPRAEHNPALEGYAAWLTVTQQRDAEECIKVISSIGKSVQRIVVDSYAIDITWEQMLRPYTKEIMVIDDLANRQHDSDYLLDQNEYLDKDTRYTGLVPDDCVMLLGYKHALLREEFYQAKKKLRKRDGIIRNILVFYGGSDHTNETMKALNALCGCEFIQDVCVNVIVGGSNLRKHEIKQFCKQHRMNYYCQVNNISDFMLEADLALGAGGSTTWERLYLGVPAIVTAIADNQVKICEDCAKSGLIDYLGFAEEVTRERIILAVSKRYKAPFGESAKERE